MADETIQPIEPTSVEQIPESVEPEIQPQNDTGNETSPTPKPETAQTPVNEPLPETEVETPEPESKPQTSNEQTEPVREVSKPSLARQLLISARNAIQFRKRKKLDKIMALFLQKSKITNDEVEKFLHVSDATATRYLSQLEKEGKIKQNGKTGHMVSYSRI